MSKINKTEVIRLTSVEKSLIEEIRKQNVKKKEKEVSKVKNTPIHFEKGKSRVLVIGDLHCPFDLDKYLDHCIKMYKEYNCNEVVFIGDIIDSHYSSYHDSDPDGFGAGEELERAVYRVSRYYKAFPNATVILGNHDRIASRKAFSGGVSKKWIKDYSEVLQTPNWSYVHSTVIDNVLYVHGEGGTARTRIKSEFQSIVQGHLHTQAYIDWIFNAITRVFGMQVGTGIDHDAYAFAYSKNGKKPAISCGVILNGTLPILIPMEL
tara:strand:+ start:278 stop:1069 length:792 start_codon:yes stop_codon:yes gene_type:complete